MRTCENAWLSPRGRFVSGHKDMYDALAFHLMLAQCILMDKWKLKNPLDAFNEIADNEAKFGYDSNAVEVLESMGWIRLHGFSEAKWIIDVDRRLTHSQERVIQDWCIENNIKYEDAFYD